MNLLTSDGHFILFFFITQAARRGDAPQFLSICHVLEFEPIYREEAKGRQKEHGGTAPGKHSGINDTEVSGRSRVFMARDSAASEMSVARVLYIKAHDAARFASLKELAEMGEDYDNDGGPGRGKGRYSTSGSVRSSGFMLRWAA